MDKKRNETIDVIKGIAILLVIYGHIIQILYSGTGKSFFEDNIEKIICSFHMPLFALVSGYLFYSTYQHRTMKEIFHKRVIGLLQPLLIWGSLYYVSYQALIQILSGQMTLNISAWWETISGPFFWFLWSMMISTICVSIAYHMKKYSIVCMVLMIMLVSVFPNGEYNMFVYPFFACGFVYHKYKEKTEQYIKQYVEWCIIGMFVVLLFFYKEDHYIYTTGISLFTTERLWIEQLQIDCFRYIIGLFGSLAMIILIRKIFTKIPYKVKEFLMVCGKKSLEIYILQCIIVSWLFAMFYSNIFLKFVGSIKNIVVIDCVVAPIGTLVFTILTLMLLNLLNKSKRITRILFCR